MLYAVMFAVKIIIPKIAKIIIIIFFISFSLFVLCWQAHPACRVDISIRKLY